MAEIHATQVLPILIALLATYLLFLLLRLQRLRARCRQAYTEMERPIRRRHELIPRLLGRAERYLPQDDPRLVLVMVARARAESLFDQTREGEDEEAFHAVALAESTLQESVTALLALDLPQWQEDSEVEKLRELLHSVAKDIDFARLHWNDTAILLNLRRESFPDLLVASVAGIREVPIWTQRDLHGRLAY